MTASVERWAVSKAAPELHSPRASSTAQWGRLLTAMTVVVLGASWIVDLRSTMAILNLAALAAAVLGLGVPSLGLMSIGLLCTLDPFAAPLLLQGGLFRWNTLNYWLLFAAVMGMPHLLRLGSGPAFSALAFAGLLALELLLTPDVMNGVQHLFTIVIVFGMLVYVARAGTDGDTWFWAAVVAGTAGFLASGVYVLQIGRVPHINPNVWSYAPLAGVLLASIAFPLVSGSTRRQLVLTVSALLNSVWVFLSGSRGSLSIAVVALAVMLLMAELRRAVVYFGLAVLLAFGVATQFPELQSTTMQRLALLVDPTQSARTRTSGRFDLFLGGWYIFEDHPLGVGTGGFSTYWANLGYREGLSGFKRGVAFPAHAAWIKVLVENGIPGIVLLAAFVASFTAAGVAAGTRRSVLWGALATLVLAVGWLSTEFYSKALWLLAAAAMFLILGERRRAIIAASWRGPGRPGMS
jgi:hypothetical protein